MSSTRVEMGGAVTAAPISVHGVLMRTSNGQERAALLHPGSLPISQPESGPAIRTPYPHYRRLASEQAGQQAATYLKVMQVAKKNSKTMTMLESLTKGELIELIRNSGFLFGQHADRRISDAKGAVARRQANQAFEQYDKLAKEAIEMPKDTPAKVAVWANKWKEAERLLRRYDRLWACADRLQFGRQKNGQQQ